MPIEMTTPLSAIDAYLQEQIERHEEALMNLFNYVGTVCINEARASGSYQDRTGNLRNSIGYVIVKDGTIVESSYGEGTGGEAASQTLRQMAAKFPHGIGIIVVAGMNYASAVEARNYNVLSSAELQAKELVKTLLQQLGLN